MKVVKPLTEILFDKLEEVSLPSSKDSVLQKLDEALGENEGAVIELDWASFGGLRRHLARASAKGEKPRFKAKVQSFKGAGKMRTYSVAILRNV